MAEFKDISLFETITPTYSELASMYIQVSATERVSLQQVAKSAGAAPLTGFTTPAGTSAIVATDTVLAAIRKLAGRTLNAPCRVVWNNDHQLAIAFSKLGIVFSTVGTNPVIKINPSPSYNLASDGDGTIINGILGAGKENEFPLGYFQRSVGSGNPTSVVPGEVVVCGSNISSIGLSANYWSYWNSSAIIYLLAQQATVPTFTSVSGLSIKKSADWDDVFGEAGVYVICLQYLYTASSTKHIMANVAKYQ